MALHKCEVGLLGVLRARGLAGLLGFRVKGLGFRANYHENRRRNSGGFWLRVTYSRESLQSKQKSLRSEISTLSRDS